MNLLFRLLVVVMLLFSADALLAQSRRVTGTITDANGPVTGASVLIKGTAKGVATDIDGNFALDVEGADPILVISGVGYTAQEVAVGTQSAITLTLEEDVTVFSDVVVTGYSVETKRETTGAVSTIKAKDLKAIPSGNVEQQLQGRVSGVTVISNGQPGTTSIIRVRGFNAFGGNEPLYVVDGVPVESTDFLAPDDIESTTVLKDAASASIYGARAANGVIVYTTKKGSRKAKALEVSYDGLYGSTDPGTGPAMMNPTDYATWTWNSIKNTAIADGKAPVFNHPQFGSGPTPVLPDYINVGGKAGVVGTVDETAEKAKYNVNPSAGGIYQVVRANKEGTDWYKAITRTAPLQRHNLGFSGGGESSRFYVGMGIQQQAGILIYNDFNRYDFRANAEFDVLKNLRVGQNLQFTYRSVLGQSDASGNGGRGVAQDENEILQAFRMPSIIPIYDVYGGYAGSAAKGFNNARNPVPTRDGIKNDNSFNGNGFGNVYAELDVIPGLTLRSSIGGQYNNFYGKSYSRQQYENSENNASFSFGEFAGYRFSWVFTNTANYKKTFGLHGIDALVGIEALNTGAGRTINGSGLNPFSTNVDYVNLNTVAGAGKNVGSNLFSGVNFYSQFGKLTYSFNDKYYVTGVLRQDASSRFGANSRVGIFPAFSAAWRVTGEDFLKGNSIITDLKIRGGWGQMGNSNNVDPNNQYSLFTASIANGSYDINGTNNAVAGGFFRNRIGNADAKWETSTTTNVGLDGTLFGGKLDVILDVWKKTTTDLLYAVPLPAVVGNGAAAPAVNIANMLNTGVDVQLINRGNITGDLKYEVTVNGGWLHNEITSLAPGITYFDGPTYRGITPVRNQVGQPISSFFGYNVLGYFKDKAEVDGAPKQADAAPGRFRYEDNNGTSADGKLTGQPDGKIDAADRTFIGSPVPTFTGGLYLSLNYKGFELGSYVYGSYGNKIYNFSKWYTDFYPSFSGAAISERVKNSWTPSNLNAETPIFEGASNFSTNTQSVSWYVEDGSYLRMQNLLVGYTLPASMLKTAGIKKVRVTASMNNLFTFTKYKGLDPSVGGAVDTNFGIDIGNYPLTRSYNIGVNLGF